MDPPTPRTWRPVRPGGVRLASGVGGGPGEVAHPPTWPPGVRDLPGVGSAQGEGVGGPLDVRGRSEGVAMAVDAQGLVLLPDVRDPTTRPEGQGVAAPPTVTGVDVGDQVPPDLQRSSPGCRQLLPVGHRGRDTTVGGGGCRLVVAGLAGPPPPTGAEAPHRPRPPEPRVHGRRPCLSVIVLEHPLPLDTVGRRRPGRTHRTHRWKGPRVHRLGPTPWADVGVSRDGPTHTPHPSKDPVCRCRSTPRGPDPQPNRD